MDQGSARRTLHTGDGLLTDKQKDRLTALFRVEEHVEVEATWGIYQRMIGAYREPDRARGKELMSTLISSVSDGVSAALTELRRLGRTLKRVRTAPRVIKRKMPKWQVKRARHAAWPQPKNSPDYRIQHC